MRGERGKRKLSERPSNPLGSTGLRWRPAKHKREPAIRTLTSPQRLVVGSEPSVPHLLLGEAIMSWSTSNRASRLPADWPSLRRQILRRDGFACQIKGSGCTSMATDVDHIRRGDDHSPSNLQSTCGACHLRKSSYEGNARRRELRLRKKRPTERHPGQR
jgi:hypothetical protein